MLRFQAELELDKDKLSINILDDDLPRPISTYSGGEKKLFTILFNLALGEIVVSRRKGGFSFMVLDEITDSLDTLHKEQVIDLLQSLALRRNKTLFIITHDDVTKDLLTSVGVDRILVENRKGISVIK